MELEYTNPNCEIVLTIKANFVELFLIKKCENWIQKQIVYIIFSKMLYLQDVP